MAKKGEFLEYKGRPLVRCGNTIYYGSMADPFVVCLKVQSEKKQGDQTIADKVIIQLLNTDEQISPKEQVVKKSEKTGLFNALDLGAVWLERALKKNSVFFIACSQRPALIADCTRARAFFYAICELTSPDRQLIIKIRVILRTFATEGATGYEEEFTQPIVRSAGTGAGVFLRRRSLCQGQRRHSGNLCARHGRLRSVLKPRHGG